MNAIVSSSDLTLLSNEIDRGLKTGPSLAAAMCGFVSTTVATTMLMVLLSAF